MWAFARPKMTGSKIVANPVILNDLFIVFVSLFGWTIGCDARNFCTFLVIVYRFMHNSSIHGHILCSHFRHGVYNRLVFLCNNLVYFSLLIFMSVCAYSSIGLCMCVWVRLRFWVCVCVWAWPSHSVLNMQ